MSNFKEDFLEAKEVLEKFISDEANFKALERAGNIMANALARGSKLISCGNGGSMCDAMHFAEELTGQFKEDRRAFAAVSISDPSHITCAANDYGFDNIFSRYLEAHGNNGDVLLAISTSGNSQNMINAAKTAKQRQMKIVALTGNDGGKLAQICDVEIRVPHSGYSDRIQEIHGIMIHSLINFIEEDLV
ncbi:MAG: D-sedoheptulose 7-phosphate isomerase [Bacteroidales bacterium]|nr:D-sedoheptulose 7-phosphate isomerase [Bacteroidales bacterium]